MISTSTPYPRHLTRSSITSKTSLTSAPILASNPVLFAYCKVNKLLQSSVNERKTQACIAINQLKYAFKCVHILAAPSKNSILASGNKFLLNNTLLKVHKWIWSNILIRAYLSLSVINKSPNKFDAMWSKLLWLITVLLTCNR